MWETAEMIETEMDITIAEGTMKTFVFHPEHDGPSPVVLYLMDAPSIRPVLKDMAMRLASAGYYVMLPFLFYRAVPYRELGLSDDDVHNRSDLMATVTPSNIVCDAEALLAVASNDPAARSGRFGAVGFCMSGGLSISLAKAMPDTLAAAASIHGAWLVRESEDSPHLGLETVTAEVYLGWADNDSTAPPEHVPVMRDALAAAGVRHTIDFLTDAVHGYAPLGTERYNRRASELHWERVHSLLRRNL